MSNWKEVGLINEFRKGNKWLIEVEEKPIALFKYKNKFYAIKNGCMHQGFPLAEGNFKSYMVECPLHGWVYDIRDGKCLSLEKKFTKSYELRIKEDRIEIKLD